MSRARSRRVALVVEEDDAEVGAVVLRAGDEAAVHVGVAARLETRSFAHMVGLLRAKRRLDDGRPQLRNPPVTIRNGSPPVW